MVRTDTPTVEPGHLMALHVAALFVTDGAGQLLHVNDVGRPTAPRFYLGRTRTDVICHVRADVPAELVEQLIAYGRDERPTADLAMPPRHQQTYRELLAPCRQVWFGPALHLDRTVQPNSAAVAVTRANAELLAGTFDDWLDEVDDRQPCYCVLEGGRAVSLCASARITKNACEAGVETLPAYRGLGHAATVVRAWAHAVAASGALPMYSTNWENAASRRVAAKCGFVTYGSDYHIT
jgi:GNAT superfamily N-acetyltransferase